MPNPIGKIRLAIHIITVVGHSGRKALRLAVPIISMIATVVQELKKKN